MNGERVFVDSNILIYAHDCQAGDKQVAARLLLDRLWTSGQGVMSVQVLQEFFSNATRKLKEPLALAKAREIVSAYAVWIDRPTTPDHVLRAVDIMALYRLSFWDSLIVAAAEAADATVLITEDLQHGQMLGGVKVENPFLGTPT